jgi:hypothetical protein
MAKDRNSIWGSFVIGDGIKSSAPWRLGPHGMDGILSDEQIGELSERFGLSTEDLQGLSRSLGWALDPEASQYLVQFDSSIAGQRAAKLLVAGVKDLDAAQTSLASAMKRLTAISVDKRRFLSDAELLSEARAGLRSAWELIRAAQASVNALMENPDAALVAAPTNKRKAIDFRRRSVVLSIVHFLRSSGRDFGFTSHDRDADRRTGPLINFVNAVVPLITDPPSTLKAETVIKDITRFRNLPDMSDDDAPVSVRFEAND